MSTSQLLFASYSRNLQRIKWDAVLDQSHRRPPARVHTALRDRPRIDQPGSAIAIELLLAEIQSRNEKRARSRFGGGEHTCTGEPEHLP